MNSSRIHVLLIHQAFVSPSEAGGTRHFELAQRMLREGHRFTIVASNISYLSGKRIAGHDKGWVFEQDVEGVRVLRAYTYPSVHRSFAWRVFSFLSFMVSSVAAGLKAGPIDLVMGTSPPLFQAVSAWLVARLRRRPFLLEIRDLWPEFAIDMGVLKSPFLITLSRGLERFLYARADHILVNSPAYRDYINKKGVPFEKVSVIANGADPALFDPDDKGESIRAELGLAGKFVATYAGALGLANDIETVLRAARRLRDQEDIRFLLVGDGKERPRLEKLAANLELPNVIFAGSRPKSEMRSILAASDACLAILMDIPMFRTTYPNKVFDYMAAGRPTILAIDGVIRQVVEEAAGGVFVSPGNDAALAEAVKGLAADPDEARRMGVVARDYVTRHFNRSEQGKEFVRLTDEIAKTGGDNRTAFRITKRLFDLGTTVAASVGLLPVLLIIALMIRCTSSGQVLFRQQRPGLNGKPFVLYKFRTMNDARDKGGNLLPDEARLTRFGKFLRSSSLDELPELFNVLKGDMSLVGPRPLLMRYLDRYSPEQMRRHEVKPGVTGWAQVNGRNAIRWEDKFKLDVWYVNHQSFLLDLKIIMLTVWKAMKREGINQPGHATAEEFMER